MTAEERQCERNARRAAKVAAWLDVIEECFLDVEADLLSRQSETPSVTGTDPEPRHVRCRHPAVNRRGRLCLSCMNTGFVTDTEVDGEKIDPYLLDPPSRYGVVQDQSDASRRARNLAQLDDAISRLERTALQRAGIEAEERPATRLLRIIGRSSRILGRDGTKVVAALGRIRDTSDDVYRRVLERDPVAVALLAAVVPGRLRPPLASASSTGYYAPAAPAPSDRQLGRPIGKNYPRSTLH